MKSPQGRSSAEAAFRAAGLQAEAINPVIDRLIAVLEEENEQIRAKTSLDFRESNLKKSRALLELTSLGPLLSQTGKSPELAQRIASLVSILERNSYLLGVQVSAMRKVTELMATAIKEGQSDGTYSEYSWRDED